MTERTRYLFNRNASTHRDAILRFAIFASIPAGVFSLVIPALFMPEIRSAEVYKLAGAMGVSILVITWFTVFGALTWVYWALLEVQFHTPAPPTRKKNVEFYVNGHKWEP